MVKVFLFGGIGNQLFQIHKGFLLAKKYNFEIKFIFLPFFYINSKKRTFDTLKIIKPFVKECRVENNLLKLLYHRLTMILLKLFNNKIMLFGSYVAYEDDFLDISQNCLKNIDVYGYWQNEKISSEFVLKIKSSINNEISKKYFSKNFFSILSKVRKNKSVSVHFRRGDYLKGNNKNLYDFLDHKYYINAFSNFESTNHVFYIFSDDLLENDVKIINSLNYFLVKGLSPIEDFILMTNCKHNITSNSTFSLWAAILNSNPKKLTVLPKNWSKKFIKNFKNYKSI